MPYTVSVAILNLIGTASGKKKPVIIVSTRPIIVPMTAMIKVCDNTTLAR